VTDDRNGGAESSGRDTLPRTAVVDGGYSDGREPARNPEL